MVPPRGGVALCVRCGAVLRRGSHASRDRALAFYLAAIIFFALANAYPILSLRLHGVVTAATIPGSAALLAELGWPWLSAILITTVILAPAVHIVGTAFVLLQIRWGWRTLWTGRLFRLAELFETWGMAEVFVLGIFVCYVKLAKMAAIMPGPSLYALGAFIIAVAAALSSLDPDAVWEDLDTAPATPPVPAGARTARQAALVACGSCGRLAVQGKNHNCTRCGATLHSRKPGSRERTWALLATAVILYIPANVLPVMRVVSLGRVQEDTIIGGTVYFARSGQWPLALIIFIASVVVPIMKITVLTFLLVAEHAGSEWSPERRAGLYRLTEFVGRWSMVDIFVVSLMVAMVELGNLASIAPGPGSVAFALLVVATMVAAHSFDPRLVWDSLEPANG